MTDQFYLNQTFKLAKKALGHTNPNPMVGAIIVKNDKIISNGFHKKFGSYHAEVEAIKNCKEKLTGSTLYVNLEPCSHSGKTPPCVDLIIRSGIKKVICSTLDPNPKVSGEGIEKLKKAGITTSIGILEEEAKILNEAFFSFFEKERPFVAIKFASSLDGKIATKTQDSKWISNQKSRKFALSLRGEYQSILIGINTVLADNPNLGTKSKNKKNPTRIILDSTLKIPLKSDVLRDKNIIIVTTNKADAKNEKALIKIGIDFIKFKSDKIIIRTLLNELKKRNILSVLVEGGGEVIGSFIDEKLIDKVYIFHSPILIGGKESVSAISGKGVEKIADAIKLKNVIYKKIDRDLLTMGYTN